MTAFFEKLREAEISSIKQYLRKDAIVLELGGGNGWQAKIMTEWGCDVRSIDLPGHYVPTGQYYPVQDYDGCQIPFGSEQFDVVFSSNVLEHVPDLALIFTEIRRVLKPDGLAIHILPTPAWRLWTSLVHYIFLVKHLLKIESPSASMAELSVAGVRQRKGWAYLIKRALFAGPHGEYPSALSELYFFSRRRWRQVFAANGFRVVEDFSTRLYYTGYSVFPMLSLPVRYHLSRFLGSACRVYVCKKK